MENSRKQICLSMTRRDERKQHTRAALISAAKKRMSGGQSLSSISLREVAREAGVVPTAFYRHFRDMDELAEALADEIGLALRQLLRDARIAARESPSLAIRESVRAFLDFVRRHRDAFAVVVRERIIAPPRMREVINREVRFFVSELAADLRLFPAFAALPLEDREMIADLIINTALHHAADLLQLPPGGGPLEQELEELIVKQVQLILLGASRWRA